MNLQGLEAASDAELLRLSAESPDAFGVFYERHVTAVLRFLYRQTACAETSADLTAETFAAAFESRRRFRDVGVPARAWVLGIARHQLHRSLRRGRVSDRARRRLGIERISLDDESLERIEELADFAHVRDELRSALQRMSPKIASALELRIGQELSYEEVAQRLRCSPAAARVRVARGLKQLSELMEVRS